MPRARGGGPHRRERRKKVLKAARGFYGGRHRSFKPASETLVRARVYAFHGRKLRKRDFRRLWIERISAAARARGMRYSDLMHGLAASGVTLDRKMLAELAVNDQAAFDRLFELAKSQVSAPA